MRILSDANFVGFDEENTSLFLHEQINKPFRARAMSDDTLRRYDDNIVRHWRRITGDASLNDAISRGARSIRSISSI